MLTPSVTIGIIVMFPCPPTQTDGRQTLPTDLYLVTPPPGRNPQQTGRTVTLSAPRDPPSRCGQNIAWSWMVAQSRWRHRPGHVTTRSHKSRWLRNSIFVTTGRTLQAADGTAFRQQSPCFRRMKTRHVFMTSRNDSIARSSLVQSNALLSRMIASSTSTRRKYN